MCLGASEIITVDDVITLSNSKNNLLISPSSLAMNVCVQYMVMSTYLRIPQALIP